MPAIRIWTGTEWQDLTGGSPLMMPWAAKGIRTSTFNVASAVPATTKLPFDSGSDSEGGSAVALTGDITLPYDGWYSAVGHWGATAAMMTAPSTMLDAYLTCAGIRVGEERRAHNAVNAGMQVVSGMLQASAGDVLSFMVGHNQGTSLATGAGSSGLPWYLAVAKVA